MIQIYDNFLSKKDFDFIKHNMLGTQFPWHIGTIVNLEKDDVLCDEIDNIQFCEWIYKDFAPQGPCLLYTSPSPRDGLLSRMPSSA